MTIAIVIFTVFLGMYAALLGKLYYEMYRDMFATPEHQPTEQSCPVPWEDLEEPTFVRRMFKDYIQAWPHGNSSHWSLDNKPLTYSMFKEYCIQDYAMEKDGVTYWPR